MRIHAIAEPPEELLPPCLGCESGVNSCDGASHLLWPSLCDETGEDSCDVASRVPLMDIRRSPTSQWAHLRCVVAVLSVAYSCSIYCPTHQLPCKKDVRISIW